MAMSLAAIDEGLKQKLKVLKFKKTKTACALIMKIDPKNLKVIEDESYEDTSVEELVDELPEHLPRYVGFIYPLDHGDGRISYPLCFIYISPAGSKPELQMLYAGSKLSVINEGAFTKVFELRSLEEFTEEWLVEKLKKYT